MYSDSQLGLEGKWFTGQEWARGDAQKELISNFHAAEKRLKTAGVKPESRKMGFPKTLDEMTASGYQHEGTAKCRACQADIEWWKTPAGKKIPMDHGTAVPHWSTCPNANDFRRPKAGRSTFEANHE